MPPLFSTLLIGAAAWLLIGLAVIVTREVRNGRSPAMKVGETVAGVVASFAVEIVTFAVVLGLAVGRRGVASGVSAASLASLFRDASLAS